MPLQVDAAGAARSSTSLSAAQPVRRDERCDQMLVVTTNDLPGWEIQRVCGEVFGLTVRSRNLFSQMGAGLKSMFGGELAGMTKALSDSRNEVMGRMIEEARA